MTLRMKKLAVIARAVATVWNAERRRLQAHRRYRLKRSLTDTLETRVMLDSSAHDLIDLSTFRRDTRFTGIDGTGMAIVVIDDSFDVNHADFKDGSGNSRVVYARDEADNDNNLTLPKGHHGTHVASIAAGLQYGVAPGAKLIMLKGVSNSSAGGFFSDAAIEKALQWVIANGAANNVVSVNMSLGASVYNAVTPDTNSQYDDELTTIGNARQILELAADGNSYFFNNTLGVGAAGVSEPASQGATVAIGSVYDRTAPVRADGKPQLTVKPKKNNPTNISVSAPSIDKDQFALSSNRDPVLTDLLAPGTWITAAFPNTDPKKLNPTGVLSGTSMATPAVAGVVALLQQLAVRVLGSKLPTNDPTNPRDLLKLLQSTGDTVQDVTHGETYTDNANPTATPLPMTGGTYKRINVERAAEQIIEWGMLQQAAKAGPVEYIELNQFGTYDGHFVPSSATDYKKYAIHNTVADRGYIFFVDGESDGVNLPPSMELRSSTNTIQKVRAPHAVDAIHHDLSIGDSVLTLAAQAAPVGTGYVGSWHIYSDDTPTIADWKGLLDPSGVDSQIDASTKNPKFFNFIPIKSAGELRLTTQSLGTFIPVISIYDSEGNLVQRVEGTNATENDLVFSDLQKGKVYTVRVGSKNYATSGQFNLAASYSLLDGAADAGDFAGTPVTGTLASGAIEALKSAANSLGRAISRLSDLPQFQQTLPLLSKTSGELTDIGNTLLNGFTTPFLNAITSATTVEQVTAVLSSINTTIGGLHLFVAPGSVAAYQDGDQTKFVFNLTGELNQDVDLTATGLQNVDGFKFNAGTTVNAKTSYTLDLAFGVKSDTSLAAADRATIRVSQLDLSTAVLEQMFQALLTQGIALGDTNGGIFDLKSKLSVALNAGAEITAAALDGSDIATVAAATPTSSLNARMPLAIRIGGYENTAATLQITDADLFDGAASGTKQFWGNLDEFNSLTPAQLLTMLRGLEEKIRSIVNLPAINTPIPFTDGKTLAQVLGIDTLLKDVNDALADIDGAVKFATSADLVNIVADLLDLPFVSQNYDPATHDLSFSIDFEKAVDTTLPFRVSVHNSVLDLTASANVAFTANAAFSLSFGVNLASTTLAADRFFIDDGRLDADVTLNVTNISGSAKLFNFLGVALSGGSGTASAHIGFDLYSGDRVTLNDIVRSISGGGAAITGSSPVPAALGNLVYTGTGNLNLGTPVLSGITFTPTGTPNLKLNLPDFKDLSTLAVDTSQLGDLLKFQNLSFDDVLAAIRQFVSGLKDKVAGSILDRDIPGTGKSIGDLISFIQDLSDAVAQLQDADAGTLQDAALKIESKLETALGLSGNALGVTLDIVRNAASNPVISMHLTANGSKSGSIPFNVDVDSLLGSGILAGLPDIASSFLNASASGTITYSGGFSLDLGFGVDLSNPLSPVPYVTDTTGLQLTALLNANNSILATLGIGPVALYINNGTVKLSDTLGSSNPARFAVGLPPQPPASEHRIPVSQLGTIFNNLDSLVTLNGAVDISLPMFSSPGGVNPLPAVGGDPRANKFTAQLPSLGGFFAGTSSPTLYSPDIASVLTSFNFTAGIGSLVGGIDILLDQLSSLFKGKMFGVDLPLIGTGLKNTSAVTFIDDIRTKFSQTLGAPSTTATTLRTQLQSALSALGITNTVTMIPFNGSTQQANVDANTTEIRFSISADGTKNLPANIKLNKGIPGLSFEVTATDGVSSPTLNVELGWHMGLSFGINTSGGFYIDTAAANEVTANTYVTFPGTTLGGSLGFLKLSATNNTAVTSVFNGRTIPGSYFGAAFSADLKAPPGSTGNRLTYADLTSGHIFDQDVLDYTLAGRAHVDLNATVGINSGLVPSQASLPKLLANLLADWQFNLSDTSTTPTTSPTISFKNVRLDAGEFIARQVAPIINSLESAITPIRPLVDALTAPLPVANDLAPLRNYIDSHGNNDGVATLRDLAQAFPVAGVQTALGFLDLIANIDSLYNSLGSFTAGGTSILSLGDYGVSTVGGVSTLAQTVAPATTLAAQIAASTGTTGTALKNFSNTKAYAGTISGANLSFPVIDNPTDLLQILLGKDVSIVQLDLPKLEFGFHFSTSFPIFPLINIQVSGGLTGFIDVGIGYDTHGLRQFKDSGYSDYAKLANGFYLRDKKDIGGVLTDIPEAGLTGSIDVFANLDAVIASVGVGGGIKGELFADLHDPNNDGRINLDELVKNFPSGIFDMYGQVTAAFKAHASIGFWPLEKTYNKTLAEIVLVNFNSNNGPAPGSVSNHVLTLAATSGDDNFVLRHVGSDATGEKIQVYGNGGSQVFTGVTSIRFTGGGGNDHVTFAVDQKDTNGDGVVDQRSAITSPATLIGGAGDDNFVGGDGNDSIDGGAGNNSLGGGAGNDTIRAAGGTDTLTGDDGNDSLVAGDGNDSIDGGAGNDTIDAGTGDDSASGGSGVDRIDGGLGNDVLVGDEPDDSLDPNVTGNDTLIGNDGNDKIAGGSGDDCITGGTGNDTIQGDAGNDSIDAGTGNDSVAGNAGNDTLLGNDGNDTLFGHSGQASDSGTDDDSIRGDAGNDRIDAGLGNDRVEAGLGIDTIFAGAGNDTVMGGSATAAPGVDNSGDSIVGGAGFDWIFGDDASLTGTTVSLIGGSGNDSIDAGDNNDTIYAGAGNDLVSAGTGNDCIYGGDGNDTLLAQAGDDIALGEVGNDQIQGFDGNDSLSGGAGNDQILGGTGLDSIYGDANDDDLYGNDGADLIYGGAGNDTAQGGAGADTLIGSGGSDVLFGHSMSGLLDDDAIDLIYGGKATGQPFADADATADLGDTISGGGGNDKLVGEEGDDALSGGAGNDSVEGNAGNDQVRGDAGRDTLLGLAGDDLISGGDGNDSIDAGTENDRVFGDAGNDTILGGTGNDRLDGGDGNDSITASDGNDTLLGRAGVDTLRGELGNDVLDAGTGVLDSLDGGSGDDLIRGSADGATDPNPADATGFGDCISGGDGDDTIYGLGGADTIDAGIGDDYVDGGADNDLITLGDGADTALGGDGNDSVDGGNSADTIFGESGNDTLLGSAGNDQIDGGAGVDCLLGGTGDDDLRAGTGSGDQLFGEAGHDLLTGSNDGADLLDGGAGDDQLAGLAGNDTLRGQAGADRIDGGSGDDLIEGGGGADILLGGADHDIIYGHSLNGAGDDSAINILYGDFGTGTDDVGAGRDQLFGGGGFDILFGEGNDDFINDFGQPDNVNFGAGDGGTPNSFVAPSPTGAPAALPAATMPQRTATLPTGNVPTGRWAEFAGASGGALSTTLIGTPVIAVDASNNRYVAWSDSRSGNAEVYVAKFDGTTWTQLAGSAGLGGISNTGGASTQPSIALDASGNPIVAWTETNASGASDIYAAQFNGSAWVALGGSTSGGGVSGTGAAGTPIVVRTSAAPYIAWLDSSGGTAQVFLKSFNGSAWAAPATNAASNGGVSQNAAGVSQLAVATDGTRVAMAWTQTVGSTTQVMVRESVGATLVDRSGSSAGNGGSNALYGASAPTLAYSSGSLYLAFVEPTSAASSQTSLIVRKHDGTSWTEPNGLTSPVGSPGQIVSPTLAVNGSTLVLGWIDQRFSPGSVSHVTFARFNGTSFVSELGASSADGFDTTSARLSFAVDSTGKPLAALGEDATLRAVGGGIAITRVFVATSTTSVQSILDANDLGPGDAIVIKGTVTGFTVAGDDSGVLIVGDRSAAPTVSSGVTVSAANVQLANLTFGSVLLVSGSGASILNSTMNDTVTLRATGLTFTGNTSAKSVLIDQAGGGVIAGNRFAATGAAGSTYGLSITAAFTGVIRNNTFATTGTGVGALLSAAATLAGNTFTGSFRGLDIGNASVTLGGAAIEPNVFKGNTTGILLTAAGTVLNQKIISNVTGISGLGTIGSTNLADANFIDNNTTGINLTGVSNVLGNRFTRNGVAIVAGAQALISQNQITSETGDGVRATAARVAIMQNTILVNGRAVEVTATASETEVRNNVLVTQTGHALYVDVAGRTGFWSDYNLIHAADGAHLVRWMNVDFDDILDWQQDVFKYDLHSAGRTLVDPSATRPRFVANDNLAASATLGGRRSSSAAGDLGDSIVDVGVTRSRMNLLSNPSFDSGTTGWTVNGVGTTLTTPLKPWTGTNYFSTGAATNGFAEQTINLLTAGFTTTQLDSGSFAALFGGRVRTAGASKAIITFLNGSNGTISSVEFAGSPDGTRWELLGGRALLPTGTRSIKVRFEGAVASTAVDAAFLYVDSSAFAPDAGFGGSSSSDAVTATPRLVLRNVDLYTDLVVDKPTTIRWDSYNNVARRAVKIDLYRDTGSGPQFLLTIAATAPDTGSFDFRPQDFGLSAGTGGYRIQLSLVNDESTFDRSSENSSIPEAGDNFYVDDASDAGDEYTTTAIGSNRNTGKLASAPKPQLTTILRTYDLGPSSAVRVDTGNYVQFGSAVISGTVGVGDDEGFLVTGPTDPAKIANITMGAAFVGFDLNDGDAVTLDRLKINGATVGVYVRSGSLNFTGRRLTIISPTLQGVRIDSASTGATLDQLTITGATLEGILADGYVTSISGSTITGGANTGIETNAGVGSITGSLVQGNNIGIYVNQVSPLPAAVISGNRVIGNTQWGIYTINKATVSGNTISGHTNATYGGIRLDTATSTATGNYLSNNAVGISTVNANTIVSYNRIDGSSSSAINAFDATVIGNVISNSATGIRMQQTFGGSSRIVRNNVVYGSTSTGIAVSASNVLVENNTVIAGATIGISASGSTTGLTVRNNIITAGSGGRGISIASDSQVGFTSDYNLFFTTAGGFIGTWQGTNIATLGAWVTAAAEDYHSLYGDPLFVNAAGNDYHEQSVFGSFKGGSLAPGFDAGTGLPIALTGTWSNDAQTSPALDRGDPTSIYANEPPPNGGHINIGAYGNTAQASLSTTSYVTVISPDGGEQWPMGQAFTINWNSQDNLGTVTITLIRDSLPGYTFTVAANVTNSGTYAWTLPTDLTAGNDYRIRVTRDDVGAATDASNNTFVIAPVTHQFYVSTTGSATGDGLSAATANTSIRNILDRYDLGSLDTINVAAGTYSFTTDLVIGSDDAGVTIAGPDWTTTPTVIFDRGNAAADTYVIGGSNASGVTIKNVTLTGGKYGVRLTTASNSDDFTLDHVRLAGHGQYGAYIEAGNERFTIRNSTVVNTSTTYGVYLFAVDGLVEGNTITGGPTGVQASARGAIVRSNTISGQTSNAIYTTYNNTSTITTPVSIKNNTVSSSTFAYGIRVDGEAVIEGNTVSGFTGSFGILTNGRLAVIKNNTVFGNRDGISVDGGTATGNNVYSNTLSGITETGATVTGNTLNANATGIFMVSNGFAPVMIANNVITNSTYAGIENRVAPQSATVRIFNNTIVGAAGRGIYISNGAVRPWLHNNLIAMSAGVAYQVDTGSTNSFNADYNLIHLTGTANFGTWQGVSYPTLAQWQATLGFEAHSLSANPLFVDTATSNYRLQNGSPAVDRGDPDTYSFGETTLSGGRADIGAYGNTASAPQSPAKLVQVLSPNGGERIETGAATNIQVRGYGIAASDPVALIDVGSAGNDSGWLWDAFSNSLGVSSNFGNPISLAGVTNAAPLGIYQDYQQTTSGVSGLHYELAVPDGTYTLRLHFLEGTTVGVGGRVMDIYLNGALAFDNWDIRGSGAAYAQAAVLTFNPVVSGGTGLTLDIQKIVNEATLCGIELIRTNAGGVVNPTVTVGVALDGNAGSPTYSTISSTVTLDKYGRGSVSFTPDTASSQARVNVTSNDFTTVTDASDGVFTIAAPTPYYYINDNTLNADDIYTTAVGNDANSGKSPDAPMASLNALLARYPFVPGSVIYIDGGTYTLTGTLTLTNAMSGITLQGAGRTKTIITRGVNNQDAIALSNADNITFTKLSVTGSRYGIISDNTGSSGVVLDDVRLFNNNTGGVYLGWSESNAIIRNSLFYGTPGGASDDNQSYSIQLNSPNAQVLNNLIYNSGNYGIAVDDNSTSASTLVMNNEVYGSGQWGISGNGGAVVDTNLVHDNANGIIVPGGSTARNNTVYNHTGNNAAGINAGGGYAYGNTIYNNFWGIDNPGSGVIHDNLVYNSISIGILNGGITFETYNNIVHDSRIGIYQYNGGNGNAPVNQIRNNLSYNNSVAALWIDGGPSSTDVQILGIANNTLVSTGSADGIVFNGGGSNRLIDLRNNIISVSGTGYGYKISPGAFYKLTSDYNLINVASGKIGLFGGVDSTTLAAWTGRTLFDKHSLIGDPGFVDAAGGNFALRSDSIGVDAGSPASPYAAEPGPNGGRVNVGHQGNTTSATTSASSRAVQVTSPDGRERFEAGQTITVTWRSTDTNVASGPNTPIVSTYRGLASGKSPAGYWRLDESTGTTVTDSSGNARGGVYDATSVTLGQPGRWTDNTAVTFNGVGNGITISDSSAMNVSGSFTLNAWINPATGIQNLAGVMMKLANTDPSSWQYGYGLYYTDDGYINFRYGLKSARAPIALNQWTQVNATWNGSILSLYINGGLAAVADGTYAGVSSLAPQLNIGGGQQGTAPFKGRIDEVALFQSALSADDIAALFNASVSSATRTVTLELMKEGTPTPVATIAAGLPMNGSTTYTLPAGLTVDAGYRIRATYSDGVGNTVTDVSNNPFIVTNNGNSYYINDNSTAGDVYTTAVGNDANNGKSPDKPMTSLQALLDMYDLDAGDIVYIDSGTYVVPTNLTLTTDDSGMAIVGAGADKTILNRGGTDGGNYLFQFAGASSVRLAKLGLTGANAAVYAAAGSGANNLIVEDSRIFANYQYGIYVDSLSGVIVRRNTVYGIPGGAVQDDQYYGARFANVSNAQILDSEFYDSTYDGINLDGPGNLIQGNKAYRNGDGIDVGNTGSNITIVRGNDTYNNTGSGINANLDGVLVDANDIHGQLAAGTRGLLMSGYFGPSATNNRIWGNYDGITANSLNPSLIKGNRVFGNTRFGIDVYRGQVLNNIVYSNSVGIQITNTTEASSNLVYANTNTGIIVAAGSALLTGNTVYQDVGDAILFSNAPNARVFGNLLWTNSGYDLNVDAASKTGFTSDNNLLHQGTAAAAAVGNWGGVLADSLADWRTASGDDLNSYAGDPLFVDIDGADNLLGYVGGIDRGVDDNFHLRANSPAIDRGNGMLQLPADASGDPRRDDPVRTNAGSTGYLVNQLGTNGFNASGGSAANWRAYQGSWTLTGINFPFFGTTYSTVYVNSSGRLMFGTFAQTATNTLEGLTNIPSIAPLWDNIRTDGVAADNIFVDSTVANQWTFRWNATNVADNSDVNFSVTLYSTGQIDFNYGAGNTNLTPTIGISAGGDRPMYFLSPLDGAATLTNANTVRFSLGTTFNDIGAFEFQGRSDDATRPTVVSTTPTAIHNSGSAGGIITSIAVNFSEPVDALDARATSVYELVGAGPDGNFGTGDDVTYTLTPTYVSGSTSVQLGIAGSELPAGNYRLTIRGTPSGNSGLHDLAGNVLDGGAGSGYVRFFVVSGDTVAPTVLSSAFVTDAPMMSISMLFSEDIGTSLQPADIVLINTTNSAVGQIPSNMLQVVYNPTTHRATITYLGNPQGVLPDGQYQLTLAAGSVADLASNGMAGAYSMYFAHKSGDFTGDGAVDFEDLLALAQNYGRSGTHTQGDANYDGLVNFDDLLALAQNYGTAFVAPVVQTLAPSTPTKSTPTTRKKAAKDVLS